MGEGEDVGPGGEWVGKRGAHGSPGLCHQNVAVGKTRAHERDLSPPAPCLRVALHWEEEQPHAPLRRMGGDIPGS